MQLKKYSFPFAVLGTVLDDLGREVKKRLASSTDVEQILDQSGPGSPSEHLHQLTRAEMDRFPELPYRAALQRVQDRNPEITRLHASESGGRLRVYADAARAG